MPNLLKNPLMVFEPTGSHAENPLYKEIWNKKGISPKFDKYYD